MSPNGTQESHTKQNLSCFYVIINNPSLFVNTIQANLLTFFRFYSSKSSSLISPFRKFPPLSRLCRDEKVRYSRPGTDFRRQEKSLFVFSQPPCFEPALFLTVCLIPRENSHGWLFSRPCGMEAALTACPQITDIPIRLLEKLRLKAGCEKQKDFFCRRKSVPGRLYLTFSFRFYIHPTLPYTLP